MKRFPPDRGSNHRRTELPAAAADPESMIARTATPPRGLYAQKKEEKDR
jgi:hypothetical protein